MAKISQEVKEAFDSVFAVVLCTASEAGQPNGNVVAIKKVVDEKTLYLSDQFFLKTLDNLKENPKVAVTFWGDKGAYQIYGTARYVNEGEEFEAEKAWADEVLGSLGLPPLAKGGCFVDVEEVYNVASGPDAGKPVSSCQE